jgi:predicted ATPase
MKRAFPYLKDISFSGSGWGWRALRLHEARGNAEVVVNSRLISDGFLRLLALTSFLYLDVIPSVVMFEEIENGVHPHLLREMVQVLRELTLRKSPYTSQVMFTTHSPYVLDEFYDKPEQVSVMDLTGPNARAQLNQLKDKTEIGKVRRAFESLGEAWYSNAIGGNPPLFPFRNN